MNVWCRSVPRPSTSRRRRCPAHRSRRAPSAEDEIGDEHHDRQPHPYSINGQVITAYSPTVTETTYLNVRGQPDSVKTTFPDAGQTLRLQYAHTPAGKLEALTIIGAGIPFRERIYPYDAAKGTHCQLCGSWKG